VIKSTGSKFGFTGTCSSRRVNLEVCPPLEPKLGIEGQRQIPLFELSEKSGKNDFLRVRFHSKLSPPLQGENLIEAPYKLV